MVARKLAEPVSFWRVSFSCGGGVGGPLPGVLGSLPLGGSSRLLALSWEEDKHLKKWGLEPARDARVAVVNDRNIAVMMIAVVYGSVSDRGSHRS